MESGEKEYVRLPSGRWWSFFALSWQNCSLWLASDHLLQVELSMSYTESAKRFYFRDIQALILSTTYHWRLGNACLGVLTALLFLLALTVTDSGGRSGMFIAGGIFALIFLGNLLAGPTCVCHLKTAVHEEKLPSLRRVRQARKIISRLQPLIEQAQGAISREEVATQFQSILQQLNLGETVVTGLPLPAPAVIKPYRSPWHRLLYGALLLVAVISVLNIFLPSEAVTVLFITLELALMCSLILALVKQTETDLKPALKSLTWGVGVYAAVNYLVGYIVLLAVITTRHPETSQWANVRALSELKPSETPWFLWLLVISATISFVLGLWGNLLLGKHWREKQPVVPVAAEAPPKL